MKYLTLSMLIFCFTLIVFSSNAQTFFIYEDNEIHQPPADLASIPLTTLNDSTTIVAYAGAIWGEHDLSDREYCIVWSVQSSDNFDEWLEIQGCQRKAEDD